jgi:uroporphyrinogen decarboxylase
MTPKEIVHNTAVLQPAERIPAALLSGGSWALKRRGVSLEKALTMPVEDVAEIFLEAYRFVGTDIVWGAPSQGNLVIKSLGGKVKFRSVGPPDVVESIIKKPDDVEKIDIGRLNDDTSLQTLQKITKHIAENAAGEYAVAGSMWGPFTLAGLMYGAENLMRDIRKNKDAVHHILDFTTGLFLARAEAYREIGLDAVSMGEPTASGDMISREHFEVFVLPALKRVYTSLRKKRLIGILHICGNINNRLDLVSETGAHIISSDYKVSLKDARSAFNGKAAFAGNMNPVDVLQYGNIENVTAACEECITDAGEEGGFILMPGCDIPPATPDENIRAMTRTAHAHSFNSNKKHAN